MFRQPILPALAIAILAGSGATSFAAEATKPNIVFVLADDFGYGDAKCYNPEGKIATPNIDRLAGEGMRFTDAHSGSAVCSPTRYGILTGRYAWRTNLRRGVLQPYDPPLIAADRLTVPKLLKQHGYHTACIGKWHLGWDWPKAGGEVVFDRPIAGGPTARGFDYYFGTHVPNHPPYCFIENDGTVGQPTAMKEVRDLNGRPGPMLPGWKFDAILPTLAERAVKYIDELARSDQPFFLYLPLTSPHEPIAPSERFRGKSGISDLADFMLETDWALGEVLAALDKHALSEKTLVIFTCDNGHSSYTGLPALQKAGHKVSGPLRGLKGDIWEGGHRVPFIVRLPGVVKAGTTCDQTICHTNLLATCADILHVKLSDGAGEDSVSIVPHLAGETTESWAVPPIVHQASSGTLAIRRGKWKLVLGPPGPDDNPAAADQLFDLASDLAETKNVAADQPAVAAELAALLRKMIADGRSTPGPAQKNDIAVPLRIAQPAAGKKK